VVNCTVSEGRALPVVRYLAEGFARAGYLAVVSDLPGLTEDRITPQTVNAATEAAQEISTRPDAENGEVAMVGVSTGATLALLAAEDPRLDGKVSLVARSLISALPPGEDRQTLSAEISGVGRENPDPLHDIRSRRTDDLGPKTKSVVRLLANRDPKRFEDLYMALPDGVSHELEELSPLAGEGKISAPVELATGPRDEYFPPSESYGLKRIAPQSRVTDALDHAELNVSPQDIPALVAFGGFVVRSLRTSRD
jgi:pimeloyl-ACP methyl ester carboxylesterase